MVVALESERGPRGALDASRRTHQRPTRPRNRLPLHAELEVVNDECGDSGFERMRPVGWAERVSPLDCRSLPNGRQPRQFRAFNDLLAPELNLHAAEGYGGSLHRGVLLLKLLPCREAGNREQEETERQELLHGLHSSMVLSGTGEGL